MADQDSKPVKLPRCTERNAYGKRCVCHLNKEGTHKGEHSVGSHGTWDYNPAGNDNMSEGEWQAYGRHGY